MSSVYGQTLLDDMVQHQGLPMALVKQAAREILEVIRSGLIADGVVKVSNFGTFRLKPVAARNGFNPQTRERITIPAHQRVTFSPCKALRELIEPVHRPPIPLYEEKPLPRAAARSAPIASNAGIATKTIVPPAAMPAEKPGSTGAISEPKPQAQDEATRPSVESRLEAVTQPPTPSSKLEPAEPVSPADELSDDGSIPLEVGEEEEAARKPYRYLYLGAAAAIVIATVTASIYFGGATDEAPAPIAQSAPAALAPPPSPRAEAAQPPAAIPTEAKPTANAETEAEAPQSLAPQAAQSSSKTAVVSRSAAPASAEKMDTTVKAQPAVSEAGKNGIFFFSERVHAISNGESLWRLARRHYQDPLLWPHIYQANAAIIDNPDSLRVGQEIVIPSLQGRPGGLTKTDRRNIAEGYYLTYLHYKNLGHKDAFFALLEAKRYDNRVVEEHRSELKLNKVEEILLSQQETMPFYTATAPL